MTVPVGVLNLFEKELNKYSRNLLKTINTEIPENAELLAKKNITNTINNIRKAFKNGYELQKQDFSGVYLKKRIKATAEALPEICKIITASYEHVTPGCLFIQLSKPALFSYDIINENNDLTFAAAVWILDNIKKAGKTTEVAELLSDIYVDSEDDIPRAKSLDHYDSLVRQMVYVIQHRHDDLNVNVDPRNPRYILDDCNAYDRPHDESPNFKRYSDILSLIPKEVNLGAAETFYLTFSEFVSGYAYALNKSNESLLRQLKEIENNLETFRFTNSSPSASSKAVFPLAKKPTIFDPAGSPMIKDVTDVQYIDNRICNFQYNLESLGKLTNLMWKYPVYGLDEEEANDMFVKNMSESLSEFTIDDPFEICAALFILADVSDSLVWSCVPCQMVATAAHMLPWRYTEGIANLDLSYMKTVPPEQEENIYDPIVPFKSVFTEEGLEDFYEPQKDVHGFNTSIAGIIYAHTGYLLPRLEKLPSQVKSNLLREGADEVTAEKLMFGVQILRALKNKDSWLDIYKDFDFDFDEEDEEDTYADKPSDDNPDSEEIAKLKQQIKALKKENYILNQVSKKTEYEQNQLKKENEFLTAELADLRELSYNLNNKELNIVPEFKHEISLPYTVKHRTIVFGGHDTWSKAIRPMLKGEIRFVDKDQNPSADMIRKSDVVWVQTNCMNHPFYWSILQTCKNAGVKFRYFTNASAEICARQIADQDISFEK